MNGELFVNSLYGDPVKGVVKLAETNNPLYGYYGFVRATHDGKPLFHHGFDYCAEEGTDVLAVGTGKILQIRIGKYFMGKCVPCAQTIVFNSKTDKTLLYFDKKKCSAKCKKGCYGIQVWLQLTNKKYAYYAHLSKLNGDIFRDISFKVKDAITFQPEGDVKTIRKGDKIGESGRTGNACDEKEVPVPHLHFECRNAIEKKGTNVNTCPNTIVRTGFYFLNNNGEISDGFTKEDVTAFDCRRKKIQDLESKIIEEGYGYRNSLGQLEIIEDRNLSFVENIRIQSLLGQIQREASSYKLFSIDQFHLI